MSIEAGLSQYLITNLPANTPIHPNVLPEDVADYPAIVYQLADKRRFKTADGNSSTYPTFFRLFVVGETYEQVKQMQALVAALLEDYTGPMGDRFIDGSLIESEIDGFERETQLHTVTIFLELWQRST